MACYYQSRRNMLVLRCDGCGLAVDIYENETDRCLANSYVHDNGWKTTKMNGHWIHLCPDCKKAVEVKNRERFVVGI